MENFVDIGPTEKAALAKLNEILSSLKLSDETVLNKTVTPSQADLEWCPRRLYFKLIGEPGTDRDTLQSLLRKEVGNTIHRVIQHWIKEALPETLIEFVPPDQDLSGFIMHGRLDLIIAGLGPYDYLGEIKSCPADRFAQYFRTTPRAYYFQMLMNAATLNFWRPGLLILVNRDTLGVAAKWVPLTQMAWESERRRLEHFIATYVSAGRCPQIPLYLNESLCKECRWFDKCYNSSAGSQIGRQRIFRRSQ